MRDMQGDEMSEYWAKAMGTVASAAVCGYLMRLTNGEHGIGWFIVALLIIW